MASITPDTKIVLITGANQVSPLLIPHQVPY